MTCPRCEEGEIIKIILKMTGEAAYLCDFCETFWLTGEGIKYNTGVPFDAVKDGKAQEHRAAYYLRMR